MRKNVSEIDTWIKMTIFNFSLTNKGKVVLII